MSTFHDSGSAIKREDVAVNKLEMVPNLIIHSAVGETCEIITKMGIPTVKSQVLRAYITWDNVPNLGGLETFVMGEGGRKGIKA